MQSTKKLSVIIPMYNVEVYVSRAAKSIAQQAFDGLEVVLVDDGSTDDSLNVCLSHLSNIETVVIRQENGGLSSARNAGINAASGAYVLFLDADDFLLPDAFENIMALFEIEQPDVLFGRYLRWSPSTGFLKSKVYNCKLPECTNLRAEYILDALPEQSWNAWRYICRREFLLEFELFFERGIYCEDIPWTLKLLDVAKTIMFLPDPFYAYYQFRIGSILNSRSSKCFIDLNNIVRRFAPLYTERPAIYRQLIGQSFFYINEYCLFNYQERKCLWQSYQKTLPLFGCSSSFLHRIAGICNAPLLFYLLSVGMLIIKYVRRSLLRIIGR